MSLKQLLAAMLLVILPLLSACASPESEDVCYIHAIGFDSDSHEIVMSVLIEKNQNNKSTTSNSENQDTQSSYTVESFRGKTISDCTEKLFDSYSKCYSGRSEIYFLGENLSISMLFDIAAFIPSSPILPAQSKVVCTSGTKVKNAMETLTTQDDVKRIKGAISKKKINAVKFFTLCTRKNTKVSIPLLTLSKENTLTYTNNVLYINCTISTK